ncbi:MAG: hypothetical protein V1800_04050 [Candidatus Latescibacterota bacterium]
MAEKKAVLGETYEPGKPTAPYNWREKLQSRAAMLKYLQTGERYWFGSEKDWFGSEKRRNPA